LRISKQLKNVGLVNEAEVLLGLFELFGDASVDESF